MEYNSVDELRVIIKKLNQQLESLEMEKKQYMRWYLKKNNYYIAQSVVQHI